MTNYLRMADVNLQNRERRTRSLPRKEPKILLPVYLYQILDLVKLVFVLKEKSLTKQRSS